MKWSLNEAGQRHGYRLCFHALTADGEDLAFPCDEKGRVDIDSLGDKARANYFFARNAVGREFAPPAIEPND